MFNFWFFFCCYTEDLSRTHLRYSENEKNKQVSHSMYLLHWPRPVADEADVSFFFIVFQRAIVEALKLVAHHILFLCRQIEKIVYKRIFLTNGIHGQIFFLADLLPVKQPLFNIFFPFFFGGGDLENDTNG